MDKMTTDKIATPIGFIDDVLRHAFWPAKQFFYDLLQAPLRSVLAEPTRPSVREAMWSDGLLVQPTVSPVAAQEEKEWTAQYHKLEPGMEGVLDMYVDPACTYIGFEISPGLSAYLNSRDVTWIDVRVSPIRFMTDVVMALRSNDPAITAVLAGVTMTHADIETEAMLLAATARHRVRYEQPRRIHEGLAPLHYVGQGAGGDGIVHGDTYFRLQDVIPDLAEELSQRDVVYLPHPGADAAYILGEIELLKSVSKSLTVSRENSYDLLCSEQPGEFFGVNSGLLQEAPFFGKPALSMLPPLCPLFFPEQAEETAGGYCQIAFDTFIDPDFWNAVLRGEPLGRRDRPRTMQRNQLRELYNIWGGYPRHTVRPNANSRALTQEVQAEVAKLRNTTQFLLSAMSQTPELANSLSHHLISQRWRWPDGGEVSFGSDGSVAKNGARSGSWRAVSGRPDVAMLIWDQGGWMDLAELDPGGNRLKCRNNAGDGFTVTAY